MGTSHHVYLGPYVRTQSGVSTLLMSQYTCSNSECRKYSKAIFDTHAKFCSACGSPLKDRDVEFKRPDPSFDVQDKLQEAFSVVPLGPFDDKFTRTWISNQSVPGLRPRIDGDVTIEITPELKAKDLEVFQEFYRNALEVLRKEYGRENVHLLWGLVTYDR